ncbi:hypothetical protein Tco_0118962, partial [Tanacetum coccineum]
VMAISIILVSSDSSKDSVGTPAERVILFGTIFTTIPDTTHFVTSPTTHIDTIPIPIVSPTIPPSPDYTPASPDYSPTSDIEFDPSEDLSSDHIPPLPATLPFLSSTDNSSDSDTPDTPPSPTHGIQFTEMTISTQSTPVASGALRCRVMILLLSPESATDLEVSLAEGSELSRYRGTNLDDVERSDGIDIELEIQAEIDECIAYADALRVRGIDARVVVEA